MDEQQWMAKRFEEQRPRLHSVAHRILGSTGEADDAVQEAWLRLSRTGQEDIRDLRAWLTTVVSRICLDMLRGRTSRREETLDNPGDAAAVPQADALGLEEEAILADSLETALFVVLELLTPAERVALVLHDMFDTPFEEIAPMIGKSPAAARQLASRARRRVRGGAAGEKQDSRERQKTIRAFLAAVRSGDIPALLALLDPEITVRADETTIKLGAVPEQRGAETVATIFANRARGARLAWVGGVTGLVWAPGGKPRVAFRFTLAEDRITAIDLIGNPKELERLAITLQD